MGGHQLPEGDELRARLALGQGALVSHAVGTLRLMGTALSPSPGVAVPALAGSALVGDGAQVFNDRPHSEGGLNGPFNPLRADFISLSVTPDGLVTITLNSWGNATQTFTATCSPEGVWSGTIAGAQPISVLLTLYRASEPGR